MVLLRNESMVSRSIKTIGSLIKGDLYIVLNLQCRPIITIQKP